MTCLHQRKGCLKYFYQCFGAISRKKIMKTNLANLPISVSAAKSANCGTGSHDNHTDRSFGDKTQLALNPEVLQNLLYEELQAQVKASVGCVQAVASRICKEVERICDKSSRIQTSGEINSWQLTLARHRIQKCLRY
jgi:hypothetical protein